MKSQKSLLIRIVPCGGIAIPLEVSSFRGSAQLPKTSKEITVVRQFAGHFNAFSIVAAMILCSQLGHAQDVAYQAAATLLPESTCLYISLPSAKAFSDSFLETDLGKLSQDPAMKPFAEDLTNQLRSHFGETQLRLGLKWEDIEGVASGEVCFAQMQPGGEKGTHASALVVDTTGRDKELTALLAKVRATMAQRKATESTVAITKHRATRYVLPKKPTQPKAHEAYIVVDGPQLIICNHLNTLTEIVTSRDTGADGKFKSNANFVHVMQGIADQAGDLAPHLRWYIDPFTAADVVRAARGGRVRRGKAMLQILQDQGFDAVRAVGGHINLATKDHEVLHRTYVYAPPVVPGEERYKGAARLLSFPKSNHLPTQSWIPRELATFASMNWKIQDGFNYATTLVDEIVDSKGFVDAVLDSFKNDKNGPMIDIRNELLAYADDHIVTFSDFELPIETDSERLLVGIRVTDADKVQQALEKLWKNDPQADKIMIGKHTVWQIIPEEDDDVPELLVGGPEIPGAGFGDDEDEIQLPNAAMTVGRGDEAGAKPYLIVSTHIDLLRKVLTVQPKHARISSSADFRHVGQMLQQLGSDEDSLLFFSRTDEEFRSAYEMIKQGKMPQSESMLGKILNRMLGPEEKNVLRQQEIDGKNLPDYQIVRRYLGPAGLFVKPLEDGWFVTGIMSSKHKLVSKAEAERANLTTAQAK